MKDRNNKEDEVWVPLKQGGDTYETYEVSNYYQKRFADIKPNIEI